MTDQVFNTKKYQKQATDLLFFARQTFKNFRYNKYIK